MNLNRAGIDLIKSFEGCRLHAYKPVAAEKYYTIGYGHYGADVARDMTITHERAEEMLVADLREYCDGVRRLVQGIALNDNEFSAMVSFAYNCGIGGLSKSTGLKLLRAGDKTGACNSWMNWNKGADGRLLFGLVRRRAAEKALFLTPVPESAPAESAAP